MLFNKSLFSILVATMVLVGCKKEGDPTYVSPPAAPKETDIVNPQDGEFLKYNAATGKFENKVGEIVDINGLQPALDSKADAAAVGAALALKVDNSTFAASQAAQDAITATKADAAATAAALALKADQTAVDAGLALKVDNSTYAAGQAAQDVALSAGLALKVDNSTYTAGQAAQDATIATKVDSSTYTAEQAAQDGVIAGKLDITTYNDDQANNAASVANKLSKTGDAMSGDLQLHRRDDTQEASDTASFGAADAAKSWFNTIVSKLKFWDGAAIQTVATESDVNAGLAGKVDNSTYAAGQAAQDAAIALKADDAAVNAALATKVDNSTYTAGQAAQDLAISTKADTSAVNAALATKVDNSTYTAGQAAQDAALSAGLALKVDNSTYTAGQSAQDAVIATKLDISTYNDDQVNNAASVGNKVSKSGDSMSGDLQFHRRDDTEEANDTSGYGLADKAKVWFNNIVNRLKFWDGAAVQQVATNLEVNSGLTTKVDSSSYSADQAVVSSTLSNKVDSSTFAASQAAQDLVISDKVDAATFVSSQNAQNSVIADKADETVVNSALSGKVDNSTYTAGQAAQDAALASGLADKVDVSVYTAGQAAQDALIAGKVDTATFSASQSAQDSVISGKVSKAGDTINGSIQMTAGQVSYKRVAAPGLNIDWDEGQIQEISLSACGNFVFANMKDGGSYTLAVTITSGTTQACVFATGDGLVDADFKAIPDKMAPGNKDTVFSFQRIGNKVYLTNTGPF